MTIHRRTFDAAARPSPARRWHHRADAVDPCHADERSHPPPDRGPTAQAADRRSPARAAAEDRATGREEAAGGRPAAEGPAEDRAAPEQAAHPRPGADVTPPVQAVGRVRACPRGHVIREPSRSTSTYPRQHHAWPCGHVIRESPVQPRRTRGSVRALFALRSICTCPHGHAARSASPGGRDAAPAPVRIAQYLHLSAWTCGASRALWANATQRPRLSARTCPSVPPRHPAVPAAASAPDRTDI